MPASPLAVIGDSRGRIRIGRGVAPIVGLDASNSELLLAPSPAGHGLYLPQSGKMGLLLYLSLTGGSGLPRNCGRFDPPNNSTLYNSLLSC